MMTTSGEKYAMNYYSALALAPASLSVVVPNEIMAQHL